METQSVPRTLVTRRELADLLRVNTSTIDRWRRRGLIRPVQFARGGAVRFKAEDVELRRAEEVGLLHEPAEHLALGYISVSTLTPIVVVLLALERGEGFAPHSWVERHTEGEPVLVINRQFGLTTERRDWRGDTQRLPASARSGRKERVGRGRPVGRDGVADPARRAGQAGIAGHAGERQRGGVTATWASVPE